MTLGPLDKFSAALWWKGKFVEQAGARRHVRASGAAVPTGLRALKTLDVPPDLDKKLLASLKKRGREVERYDPSME